MTRENDKQRASGRDIDRGPIASPLESDNAFSDKGLENAELTNNAMKKTKS